MYPAFAHFRRTATCDTELAGQPIHEGDKVVMWYVSSNRDESRYENPSRLHVRRNPEHQAFGAGGRHFCLGTALARLELKVMFEETLARYPAMEPAGRRRSSSRGSSTSSRRCPCSCVRRRRSRLSRKSPTSLSRRCDFWPAGSAAAIFPRSVCRHERVFASRKVPRMRESSLITHAADLAERLGRADQRSRP